MAARIRKGDQVIVLTGRDRGRRGEVLRVIPARDRVVVQGVNIARRHRRSDTQGPGGITEIEKPIHVSNVAHADPESGRPTRVGFRRLDDGRKVRVARRSDTVIDR